MYQTTVGTRVVSFEPPEYVKLCQNGFFLPCDEEEAQAISANDNLYAISPDIPVPGHPDAPVAVVKQIPDDSYTLELIDVTQNHTGQICDLETGATELADALDATATETQDALCELAETIATSGADIEDGLCELAGAVEITTVDIEDALVEQADATAEGLVTLTERADSADAAIVDLDGRVDKLSEQAEVALSTANGAAETVYGLADTVAGTAAKADATIAAVGDAVLKSDEAIEAARGAVSRTDDLEAHITQLTERIELLEAVLEGEE